MFFSATLVLGVLALESQVVLSSQHFKFKLSQVQQCEPVSITFAGDADANAIPMSLTLLPFGSQPISVPIPNAAANTSGIYVTFFPFVEGTTFMASLDDNLGENVATVSDVIRVLPSPTGNTTCLPTVQDETTSTRVFTLDNTLSQCEECTVSYNRSVISTPPTVRLYSPEGPSFILNRTSEDSGNGSATYLVNRERMKQVVLLFDDGQGHRETSTLMTIGGDSESRTFCLASNGNDKDKNTKASEEDPGISQGIIIGSAVGGGAIVLISILMILFILRERRHRRRSENIRFDASLLGNRRSGVSRGSPSSPNEKDILYDNGFVRGPPYTPENFRSSTIALYPRASMASWAQATPEDQRFPANRGPGPLRNSKDDLRSLNSLDIEGMLNKAAVQSARSSRTVEPLPYPAVSPTSDPPSGAHLTVPRLYPARRHRREPSDVPSGPNSVAFSSISMNPFVEIDEASESSARPLDQHQRPLDLTIRLPPGALIGIPSSPRNGPHSNREMMLESEGFGAKPSNRSTKDSMGDWYGITR